MLAKLKPGDRVTVGGKVGYLVPGHERNAMAVVDEQGEDMQFTLNEITSISPATYAPAYKLGEPETVTREQAFAMFSGTRAERWEWTDENRTDGQEVWYDNTNVGWAVRKPQEGYTGGIAVALKSPGGNVYRIAP
jgi:hypothetical protein